ncbi:MAG TPA: hypothetical protein VLC53_19685, partial [Myxococcota bacterium]|nr:hypothetical protein [Myxococcota bacterium]
MRLAGAGRAPLPRRAFLAALVQALATWPLLAARPVRAAPAAAAAPMLAVVPADAARATEWRRGLELGAEEAKHTARLLGRAFAFRIASAPASESAARAASARLSALAPAENRALAAHAAAAKLPLLVLRSGEPGEAERLGATAFFVASSLQRRLEALTGLLVREEGRRRWVLGTAPEGDGDALRVAAAQALAARGGSLL